ncbi:MAG: hypothetical protein ACI4RA_03665 [Kiritimatiellia bacterium]
MENMGTVSREKISAVNSHVDCFDIISGKHLWRLSSVTFGARLKSRHERRVLKKGKRGNSDMKKIKVISEISYTIKVMGGKWKPLILELLKH